MPDIDKYNGIAIGALAKWNGVPLSSLTSLHGLTLPAGGGDLITNGSFDSDILGWTAFDTGVISWDAGTLLVNPFGSSLPGGAYQIITTEVGVEYQASVDFDGLHDFISLEIGTTLSGKELGGVKSGLGVTSGTLIHTFTATTTSTYVHLTKADRNGSTNFDNVVVAPT